MSKPLVVLSTVTGNTSIIAHAVADAFETNTVRAAALPEDLSGFNPVILCFWCDRGMAPEDIKALAPRLEGKKIACLCTMGGDPETERSKAWMAKTCDELTAAGKDNTLCASFLCRGRIDPELFARMTAMTGGEVTPERQARRDASEAHPDRLDVLHAVETVKKAFC